MKRSWMLWAALALFTLAPAFAQNAAPATTGKVHGRILNPTGAPQKGGTVSFEGPKAQAMPGAKRGEAGVFTVSDSGEYAGEMPAGVFTLVYRAPGIPDSQITDKIEKVAIVAGQDNVVDDDMSRKAFIDALPEDKRKELSELKRKNKELSAANEVIKNLNNDLKRVGQDLTDAESAHKSAVEALGAGASPSDLAAKETEIKIAKYTEIVDLMKRDTLVKADASVLWGQLGQGQMGLKQYADAEASFKKALEIEEASKKPNAQILGLGHSGLGEIYARAGKVPEANAAFDAAAKANPAQAAFFFKNEAVIFMQVGNADAQLAAADQGIKADPGQPVLYYLKGQSLVSKATLNAAGKIVLPDGCAEAYQKYLELAPDGSYAAEVKAILTEAGQTHTNSYDVNKNKNRSKGK